MLGGDAPTQICVFLQSSLKLVETKKQCFEVLDETGWVSYWCFTEGWKCQCIATLYDVFLCHKLIFAFIQQACLLLIIQHHTINNNNNGTTFESRWSSL